MNELFKGELVRLSAVDPDEAGKAFTRWNRDSEFMRLLDSNPTSLPSQRGMQKALERDLENQKSDRHWFTIHALVDDKLLGDINLFVDHWAGRDAFVGLGIGERDFWGKGYGTDVMKVILRYAFTEVNLRRVTLNTFEYNPRAIRSYEKAGFRHEGRQRQFLNREGKRWDLLYMGILREEWMNEQEKET
jgi:RimJ/RimL family protein N-acetyltransferase